MDDSNDVHEYLQLAGPLGVIAIHGGGIEPGTEEIARYVAKCSGASLYVYAGRRAAGNILLHQTSHTVNIEKRPLAVQFLNHVYTAISIHGHGREINRVYAGGLHENMVQRFVELARPVLSAYEWISDPEITPPELRGRNPFNIVNLPPGRGMQLELPRKLREIKPVNDQKGSEPAGDALVLSRLLVRFVSLLIHESN
jgi:phage replication-related protein YjqB (UPF0714/DUF867 family)